MELQTDQNRTQNSTSKKKAFKTLLEPSWVVLGSILGSKNIKIHKLLWMFRENHVFEEDNAWKGILGRTWVDLVANKGSKRHPNRSQNGAKLASKTNPNIRSVLDRSYDEVGRERARKANRAGAAEGVRGRHKSLPRKDLDWIWIYWIGKTRSTRPEGLAGLGGFLKAFQSLCRFSNAFKMVLTCI